MVQFIMEVCNGVLALFIAIGAIFAYFYNVYGKRGKRVIWLGFAACLIVAIIRAIIANTTRLRGAWLIGTVGYIVAITGVIAFVAMLITMLVLRKKNKDDSKQYGVINLLSQVFLIISLGAFMVTPFNSFLTYPYKFYDAEVGILSSEYLLKLLGYIIGVVICISTAVATFYLFIAMHKKGFKLQNKIAFGIIYGLYTFLTVFKLLSILTPRNIIKSDFIFELTVAVTNRIEWVTYIEIGVMLFMTIFLIVKSITVKEKYKNNAEHRKQAVVWRSGRRAGIVAVTALLVFILCQTWFVKLTTTVIQETPVEDPIIIQDGTGQDSELRVPLTSINDGHLHKFEYKTPDSYKTRFVVILKQLNTANYGVGLDACEICGEAGYYENDKNQVVCKKCGVIMNTMTIGMKGGCNPIIIDYDVTETYLTVPVSEMVKNQEKFKKGV